MFCTLQCMHSRPVFPMMYPCAPCMNNIRGSSLSLVTITCTCVRCSRCSITASGLHRPLPLELGNRTCTSVSSAVQMTGFLHTVSYEYHRLALKLQGNGRRPFFISYFSRTKDMLHARCPTSTTHPPWQCSLSPQTSVCKHSWIFAWSPTSSLELLSAST